MTPLRIYPPTILPALRQMVAEQHGISVREMMAAGRRWRQDGARKAFVLLARKHTSATPEEIAAAYVAGIRAWRRR